MDLSDRKEFIDDVSREGLGGSLAIYAAAIFGVLALIAVPIYAAVAPQVYDNPPPQPLDPLLQGPIIGNRVSTPLPLSHLRPEILADPKYAAELSAKGKKTVLTHHQAPHVAHAREGGPAMAETPSRRERSGFFLFSLFGG